MKLLTALALFFATATLVPAQDRIITPDRLPAAAQTFIQKYFPDSEIMYAKKDRDLAKVSFEVMLQGGVEIEFNGKGEWDKVDCKRSAVPAELVPSFVTGYVDGSFPGQFVVKIDKEPYGFEVELSNDLELKFDKKGKLLDIDD